MASQKIELSTNRGAPEFEQNIFFGLEMPQGILNFDWQ
jgi:hypothetical protein